MKNITKLKKNFVINTKFVKNSCFNEPVYILDAGKDFVEAYSEKNKKIIKDKLMVDDSINTKTFISIKEFFKKCSQDSTEYKVEKINEDFVFISVANYAELTLFFRLSPTANKLFLTNINTYKFIKTKNTAHDALNNIKYIPEFEKLQLESYLKNMKNLKRDYIFLLNQSLDSLEREFNAQNSKNTQTNKK